MHPTALGVNNNRPVSIIFSPITLMMLLIILSLTFLPEILETGTSQWMIEFRESESPILHLFMGMVLETYISLWIVLQIANYFEFKIRSQDLREIWVDQLNQNIPLQFLIMLLGRRDYSSSELLIYSHNLVFYLIARSSSCYLQSKSRHQASEKITRAHMFLFTAIMLHVLFMHMAFGDLDILMMLILHYEGLYILKDSGFSLHLLYCSKEMPIELELQTAMLENLVKVTQWIHIALAFSDIIPTNPANVFLFLKVQQYFVAFSEAVKKYRQFSVALERFLKQHPVLNESQISSLQAKYCCICMDAVNCEGCQLTCSHVFHLVCISKWMLTNKERKCPLCSAVYLDSSSEKEMTSLISLVTTYSDGDVATIQGLFPYIPEEEIRRELQNTRDIDLAIENLLVNY